MTFGARSAIALLVVAAAPAFGASFKVTLLVIQNDARLDRNRTERAYLSQPGGPASDGVALALEEANFELEAGPPGWLR